MGIERRDRMGKEGVNKERKESCEKDNAKNLTFMRKGKKFGKEKGRCNRDESFGIKEGKVTHRFPLERAFLEADKNGEKTDHEKEEERENNQSKGKIRGENRERKETKENKEKIDQIRSLSSRKIKKGVTKGARCMPKGDSCSNHSDKTVRMKKVAKGKNSKRDEKKGPTEKGAIGPSKIEGCFPNNAKKIPQSPSCNEREKNPNKKMKGVL